MRVALNGSDWLFKGFLGEDWVWRNAEKPNTRDVRWWNPGTVPGSVHHDLWQLGQLPNPYFEQNSLLIEWVPQRTWIYKKSFTADPAWQGQRVSLHFEGIDYSAQIFLNGKPVGQHRGMYHPAIFEVADLLEYGAENLLAVVIDRAPDEEPQVSKTEYVHTHKSRMTYWWDFCPRMIHIGIWDDVYLDVTGSVQVKDLWVRPELNADFTRADLAIAAKLDAAARGPVEVETIITREGQEVARQRSRHALAPGETNLSLTITVQNPDLWWPNGHGAQPLYEAEMRVLDASAPTGMGAHGAELHSRKVRFGIRQIEAVTNEGAAADALAYTLVVNGKKIYIKGWNWVPIDAMYGVPRPAKLQRLISLAQRANVNLLRVWGGGLIEQEAFYDLCDRNGILVWQEFILSSSGIANKPSESPEYVQLMINEAERIIPRRRNHPSLAIWCGGNELMADGGIPLTDAEPALGALHDVVRRLDPDRHWLPTSPSGPTANNTVKQVEIDPSSMHDVHGPWEHQGLTEQYTLYNVATMMLHSEFGAEGMTNIKTLNATISPANQWPTGRDNPIYFHLGSWWNNEALAQKVFDGIQDVETMSRASQFLQFEALRYALEANRRRQWHQSGSIPWQFNEPYPNAWCTASVDYYAEPKGGYWAVKQAYEELTVTARFETQAWGGRHQFAAELFLANSGADALSGLTLSAQVVGAGGRVFLSHAHDVTATANGANRVAEVALPLGQVADELFFLDLTVTDAAGTTVAANRYPFVKGQTLAPTLNLPQTSLAVTATEAGSLSITNTGETVAFSVRLDDGRPLGAPGWAYFGANHFHLLPGERRTVAVEWQGAPAGEQPVEIRAWNTGVVQIG